MGEEWEREGEGGGGVGRATNLGLKDFFLLPSVIDFDGQQYPRRVNQYSNISLSREKNTQTEET